jgi:plasmid stabilization system protein ParE
VVKLIWAPKAIRDLDNILDYISMDSEKNASLVIKGIINLAEPFRFFQYRGEPFLSTRINM